MAQHQPRYTNESLALYARYVDNRRDVAPLACKAQGQCWVLLGPPALNIKSGQNTKCIECDSIVGTNRSNV